MADFGQLFSDSYSLDEAAMIMDDKWKLVCCYYTDCLPGILVAAMCVWLNLE